MKKMFFILIFLAFWGQIASANELCPSTYELTSGWKRFASVASGSNFIHKTMLEKYLENQTAEKFPGKYKIKITSFSANDLKAGKFKSLTASGDNVSIDKLTVSKITLNSICAFNQIEKTENSKYRFVTDFPANVTFELSSDNLNQITQTTDFKKSIKEINRNLLGFLRIEDLKFDIKENKLLYNFIISTPFSPKKQAVSISTALTHNGNNIIANNAEAQGKSTILTILNMPDALNYVNPLDFSAKILENSVVNADIKDVYINEENKVIIKAFVNIRK